MSNYEEFQTESDQPWLQCFYPHHHHIARKRNRNHLYTVSADSRHALVVFINKRVSTYGGGRCPMTLDNARKPWWMSARQYQQMLTRLGLPF